LEKAEEVEDPGQKDTFRKLADEEQKHYRLVDSICEFVARPQWFLENAEMYRFDDYAGGSL
jgi:rubrerythrin